MRNKVNEDDQVDSAYEGARGILTILQSAVLLLQPSIFGLGYREATVHNRLRIAIISRVVEFNCMELQRVYATY